MRRLFGWTAGLVSIAALARVLARRRRHETPPAAPADTGDPADELRRKLSETRGAAASEAAQASPTEPGETLEERRLRVHAKAQEAIDAMQETPQ